MKLKKLKIQNFRGYRTQIEINLNDLTAFIGKNDAGKSTVLEALDIFFNSDVKPDKHDLNVDAKANNENFIAITCIFSDLPKELVIDAANPTTLQAELLLNSDGCLEIKKVYTGLILKETTFIVANHPTCPHGNDLLTLKRAELKVRANELQIAVGSYNANLNSSIRASIWNALGNLQIAPFSIQIDKEDTKRIWDFLELWMPQYALFKSDRNSSDGDKEITDPMKVAINSALAELGPQLHHIQQAVKERAIEVAERTLAKLQEMNPALANELTPDFKAEPKWASLFNLTLASDREIPINKRGSGIRRLIVLNFFRAEAERRREDKNSKAIIYAFEEPETSQHPDHQEMLIKAFLELAETEHTQVLLTTHNPSLAGLVNENDLRFVVHNEQNEIVVQSGEPNILRQIADALGMLPDPLKPLILICVEGPNDVVFLKHISRTIHLVRNDLPDIANDTRIAIFPLGGGTLKDWVTHDYLSQLGICQYHLYDLDDAANPPYQDARDTVRARGNNSWADLTGKRETENYLHPTAIQAVYGLPVTFTDMDDVPEIVASLVHAAASPNPWATLTNENKKKKSSNAKRRLNSEVALLMTWPLIQDADPNGDIISWLEAIRDRIN